MSAAARARVRTPPKPPLRWVREAWAVVVFGIAAYLGASLLSYDPGLHWLDQETMVGVVGLWLGWALFTAAGDAGYLVPLALGAWAVSAVVRTPGRLGLSPLLGTGLGLAGLAGLLARVSGPSDGVWLHRGGLLGRLVDGTLRQALGDLGSLLVLLTALAVAGLCLIQTSYAGLSRRLATALGRALRRRPRPGAAPGAEPAPEPPAIADLPEPPVAAPAGAERPRGRAAGPPPGDAGLAWQETFNFGRAGQRFQLPSIALLGAPPATERRRTREELQQNADLLRKRLEEFGVSGRIVQVNPGPIITGYEFEPAPGVKVNQVVNLADDLALAMKAGAVRVFGPVPGRGTVAIEVPNPEASTVSLREILAAREFADSRAPLPLALGKDAIGQPYVTDLAAMPHLLIAGATGSGKSAGLNSMICSILYRRRPSSVRFLMIDPKRLELGMYDGIPHLLAPVVTDPKEAAVRLRWIVGRMDERYKLLAAKAVRNIEGYNREVPEAERLPYWVVIVDELADLMMVSAGEVETSLARLAQIARAVGIHLMIATQRPSVDVITGLIKANFPARIAFQVASKVDSRTILDQNGAEHLLGRGDMLFLPPGSSRPIRIHGAWVSEGEVREIAAFLRQQGQAVYEEGLIQPIRDTVPGGGDGASEAERDDVYWRAVELVISQKQASISFIQRRLGLGYPKAARFIDLMEQDRIIGPGDGAKPRQILVGPEYLARRAAPR
jgi:S-DNA-T family DNA segregation ATPase FtsK/SpoIIIE